jgi:uncharacterized protein
MVSVTAFFAGLLGFLFIVLSIYVIKSRYKLKVAVGDGGSEDIIRRMRAHANFAEYTPIVLILMAVNELEGSSKGLLTWIGVAFVIGRMSHAYGMLIAEVISTSSKRMGFRMVGTATTFTVIIILSLMAIF